MSGIESTNAGWDDAPRLFAPDPEATDVHARLDAEGRIVFVSERTRQSLGMAEDHSIGASAFDTVHAADVHLAEEAFGAAMASPGVPQPVRLRARSGEGPWHDFELRVVNLLDDPEVGAVLVEGDDVSERAREAIASHVQARVLDHLPAAVIVTDAAGVVVYWNQRASDLYGYSAADAVGRTTRDLGLSLPEFADTIATELRSTGTWEGETEVRCADGSLLPVLLTIEPVSAPELGFEGRIAASIDNTERRALRDTLAHQALHDPLTGLPNRALFLDRLDHALARLRRDPGMVGVLFMDLDRFKIINDTLGHDAGDDVLRSVASLFEAVLRPGDTVARLGGDEFAVCCENLHDPSEVMTLADRLSAAVSLPFVLEGREFFVTPSIGVVLGTGAKGESASTLLRDADAAMYVAKDRGRGRVEVFDKGMRQDVVRRAELTAELRHALQRDEFCLHFQPLVGLADGELRGFEALLRWDHPERGLVPPGEFIDVAEDTNLIIPIGRWVLEEAARQVAAWRDELPEHPISISVNISARQLADPDLVRTVRSALTTCEIEPSALCLEITESVLMEDAQTSITTLRNLKALGVELSIDDFGTGYSSLAYLKRFPVDYLKIDRSFVHGIGRESEDTVIVKAVVDLGAALGLAVVAEGVETEAQLAELRRIGCDAAQGYWWSIPLPPAEAVRVAAGWEGHQVAPLVQAAAAEESSVLSTEELLRVLTHEMATPLTVVRGQCERLLAVIGDLPEAAPLLQAVIRNAQRIDRLVTSLSDAQQLEIGALSVRPAEFDLVSLVRDVAPTVLPEERELRIEAPAEVTVEADGARVEQILVNLLTNAEKFSPPETPITIVVEGDDDEARVVVADEGPGVPPERAADIFRKFARLQRSKKGVGLGLFLSRRLARAHGGELQYRRRQPVGSEFVLTLPCRALEGQASKR